MRMGEGRLLSQAKYAGEASRGEVLHLLLAHLFVSCCICCFVVGREEAENGGRTEKDQKVRVNRNEKKCERREKGSRAVGQDLESQAEVICRRTV